MSNAANQETALVIERLKIYNKLEYMFKLFILQMFSCIVLCYIYLLLIYLFLHTRLYFDRAYLAPRRKVSK